jgi:hypothetical protein
MSDDHENKENKEDDKPKDDKKDPYAHYKVKI